MVFTFLLVVQFIVAALLVTVILMQRSEGGGLTSGGSPSGLMSARGAADFLTRSTAILATLFIVLSILLAVLAANQKSGRIDTSLRDNPQPAAAAPASNTSVPLPIPGAESGNLTIGVPTTSGNSAVPNN